MFEFLTPGQKLKKLRKELHLTQAQLASGTISREYISMVEHDVREMSIEVSELIYHRLKTEAEKDNKYFPYDQLYLSRSYYEEIIFQLRNLSNLESPEELLKLKAKLADRDFFEANILLDYQIGKIFLQQGNIKLALEYTRAAYDASISLRDIDIQVRTCNNLGEIKVKQNQLVEALNYFKTALKICRNNEIRSAIFYNIVKTLYLKEDYQGVEEEISTLDFELNKEYSMHIDNLNGLSHLQKNNLNAARRIFTKLIDMNYNDDFQAMVFSNLSEVELQSKNFDLAVYYNEKSAQLRKGNINLLQENILNSAHILWYSGAPEEASGVLEDFINTYTGPRLGNAFKLLSDIYKSQKDVESYFKIFKKGLEYFYSSNQINKLISYMATGSEFLGEVIPLEYYSSIRPFLNKLSSEK